MRSYPSWLCLFGLLLACEPTHSSKPTERREPSALARSERIVTATQPKASPDLDGHEHASKLTQECTGCHTDARGQPTARFANGLGRWRDDQCYGCHAEINEVATAVAGGVEDARYFALPVSKAKLNRFAQRPLAYMNAPQHIAAPGVARISLAGLGEFLRRPARLSESAGTRAPRMLAYPSLQAQELEQIAQLMGVDSHESLPAEWNADADERRRIAELWTRQCAPCHMDDKPVSGRSAAGLSLYTPDWIFAYANGHAPNVHERRAMPTIPLTREDATGLYYQLRELRKRAEASLDARTEGLSMDLAAADAKVSDAFVSYLWGDFFRDATCVHCHATSPRASEAFRADAHGLAEYLKRKSGTDFWRRLEIRALEAEYGLVAHTPGMPMAGVELPEPLRRQIGTWVRTGCRGVDGREHCPNG